MNTTARSYSRPTFEFHNQCEQIFSLNIASVSRPYWNIWQKKNTERNKVATVDAEFFSVVWRIWVYIWTTIEVNGNCDKPCRFHSSVEMIKSKPAIYFLKLFKHHIIIMWYDIIVHKNPNIIQTILWKPNRRVYCRIRLFLMTPEIEVPTWVWFHNDGTWGCWCVSRIWSHPG